MTIGGFIVGLFGIGGPTTVLGTIGTIIVDPINACAIRSHAHIGKECQKASFPAVTDGNATPAVAPIVGCFRIQTASLNAEPSHVFMRPAELMGMPWHCSQYSPERNQERTEWY